MTRSIERVIAEAVDVLCEVWADGCDGISLMHLLETTQTLHGKQVNLVSLRENIDTNTATGRCFLSMMGAMHQMERELRAERAAAGRASAKARGKTGGRPRTDVVKLRDAKVLYDNSGKAAGMPSPRFR